MPIGYTCIDGMMGRMKDGSSAQSASSVNPLSDEPRFKPSTMTSQIIDTVVFIGIAFGIGFGWLFDSAMLPQLGAMMVGQYLLKFCLAAIDTPFSTCSPARPMPTCRRNRTHLPNRSHKTERVNSQLQLAIL